MIHPSIRRRSMLLGLATAFTLGRTSLALAAAPTEKRLVVVLLRGAMDGLAAVVPYGDRDLAGLRGGILPPGPGEQDGLHDLGGFYGMHPALVGLHGMYAAGELAVVHAVAGHYRSRSHFEAQDYLESGVDQRLDTGWLNRVAQGMPEAAGIGEASLAVGVTVPLLLRGQADVATWAPSAYGKLGQDLYRRIADMNRADPLTGPAIADALAQRGYSDGVLGGAGFDQNQHVNSFQFMAAQAGRLLAAKDGPRIAAMEIQGWDTHTGQVARLRGPLTDLDYGLSALKQALGTHWRNTAVLVLTEFGRTVHVNGTGGTDHGTGGVCFVAGGAVAGGRVVADWPGLGRGKLFEDRDLAPTTDLRSVVKGVLKEHLGLGSGALEAAFPGSLGAQPMTGLIRA